MIIRVLAILTVCLSFSVFAQPIDETTSELTIEERLVSIHETLDAKKAEKKIINERLKDASSILQERQIKEELAAVEDIIQGLEEEFVTIAAGKAKLYVEPTPIKEEFDWRKDLQAIVEPLLGQMRDLSERPRKIEELETEQALWESRVDELTKALESLNENQNIVSDKRVSQKLKELVASANSRLTSAKQKLTLTNNELNTLLETENPLWENLGTILKTTVVSMLLHLLLAFLSAMLIYQIISFLCKIPIWIINKRKTQRRLVLAERLISLTKRFLSISCATLGYLVVLYAFSEWLLLVISVLVVVAALISLKDAIPQYLVEIRTVLNLGSVRQGEVIKFEGIQWIVQEIDIYSRLHNPALDTELRIPITHIADLHSRPLQKGEPLFPTKVGDVVMLEDNAFGKVKRQSPETVHVDFGGSIYHYQTSQFLERRPRNLSNGFTVYEVFGIDYSHQADINEILPVFKKAILDALKASPYNEHKTYFGFEFDKAAASSLDYKVIVGFTGAVAEDYFRIHRFLQKAAVDAANANGWGIPFQQITVHQA